MNPNFPVPSLDKGSQELTEEYIQLRAYQLFESRGYEHGHDLEDWLHAEAEVLGMHEASAVGEVRRTTRKRAAAR